MFSQTSVILSTGGGCLSLGLGVYIPLGSHLERSQKIPFQLTSTRVASVQYSTVIIHSVIPTVSRTVART